MSRISKTLTAGLAALALGASLAATATPADAQGRRGFGPNPAGPRFAAGPGTTFRSGPGWARGPGWGRGRPGWGYGRPGWGYGYGWRPGWGGPGPWVAGAVGGLAVGALAAGAYDGYGYGCVANRPMYDAWGNFLGYRRVRVAC